MLTRSHRFHGHNAIRPIYQKGKSAYSANCKLLWSPAQRQDYRVAVVVSKKVHKSAVVRNRIRRRLYEIVRLYAKDTELQNDYVFVVQSEKLASLPPQEVIAEIQSLLKKSTSVS